MAKRCPYCRQEMNDGQHFRCTEPDMVKVELHPNEAGPAMITINGEPYRPWWQTLLRRKKAADGK